MAPPKRVKSRRAATQFNLLVAGKQFSGKTSFIKTLYDTLDIVAIHPDDVDDDLTPLSVAQNGAASVLPPDTIHTATPSSGRIDFDSDNGERISLRIVDTPGIPIPVNIHKEEGRVEEYVKVAVPSVRNILSYLEAQFEATLLEESKVRRNPKSPDYQIHACLYFLDPQACMACRGLTAVDRYALEQLCQRVNVIVCLAKADLLTVRHLRTVRSYVVDDLARYAIPVFAFPEDPDVEYDKSSLQLNEELRNTIPFAIVNAEDPDPTPPRSPRADDLVAPMILPPPEPRVVGREYPWGVVEVENPQHCDFVMVKDTLFATHTHELKLLTRELYYEQWRTEKLLQVRSSVLGSVKDSEVASVDDDMESLSLDEELQQQRRKR
ncbi:hypothetical protein HDU85_007397 [Gaertneriomyces sp. JEL0708]|nr:hypothetical protein HDU85_007397 [Gaertneriomyces sp. JEL0708]